MGSVFSARHEKTCESRKRTFDEVEKHDEDAESVVDLPKRKKLKGTSGYIYQTLFIGGEGSDVTISALGQEWKVHRVYLRQSKYFQSMFSGQWKESQDNFIHIQVPDNFITVEAMNTALGSLYSDDITVSTCSVIPLMAAGCLLQLDNLVTHCSQLMTGTVNSQTVCQYYTVAKRYGEKELEIKCIQWLERALTSSWTVSLLKEISIELMQRVVQSSGLFVMQIEIDVYTLLIIWVFLQLNPDWTGSNANLKTQSTEFFRSRNKDDGRAFLISPEGEEFVPVFKGLRLHHVINDIRSMMTLQTDNVIPSDWLNSAYMQQWKRVMFVYQNIDHGPSKDLTMEEFNRCAHRYGRILENSSRYCWRWTGFLYGLDIIVMYNNRTRQLSFRRNTYLHPGYGIVCNQQKHNFVVKVEVAAFDSDGHESFYKTSGLKHLSLGLDEEVRILQLDKQITYPVYVSAHIAMVTPSLCGNENQHDDDNNIN